MPKKEYFTIANKEIEGRNVMRIIAETPEPLENTNPSIFTWIYNDKGESRPYTPLKIEGRLVHYAIKIYENGPLSSFLESRKIGDKIEVSGPEKKRKFIINEHKNILMICGGTGITPMFQILNYAMNHPDCRSSFKLLFYNTTGKNIFLSKELEELRTNKKGRLDIRYILTGENKEVDKVRNDVVDPVKEACSASTFDFVYVCGTDGFLGTVCGKKTEDKQQGELEGTLKELKFTSERVYKF